MNRFESTDNMNSSQNVMLTAKKLFESIYSILLMKVKKNLRTYYMLSRIHTYIAKSIKNHIQKET